MTPRHTDSPRHFDPIMLLSQVCSTPLLDLPQHISGLPASEFHASLTQCRSDIPRHNRYLGSFIH